MTARFAGSRQLDDRRRRRLAQESDQGVAARRSPSSRTASGTSSDSEQDDVHISVNADESLIPKSYWKISTISLVGFVSWISVLWLGTDTAWQESALEEVVSLQSGRLAKFFSTVALLVASQLSTLILWYRSKSRKDFSGRYRMWAWGSVYWSTLCMAEATGFHHPLAQLLYDYWKFECWRPETMYWLAPAAAGFAALYQLLNREFRQSTPASVLWKICAAAGLVTLLLTIGLDLSIPESSRLAANVGAATFWHLSAAVAMLFQARFVVHVNNEAAPRKKVVPSTFIAGYFNLIRRLLMIRWPRITLPKLPRWKVSKQSSETLVQEDSSAKVKKKPSRKKKANPTDAAAVADASVVEEQIEEPVAQPAPRPVNPPVNSAKPVEDPKPAPPVATKTLRVDPPAVTAPAPKVNPVVAVEEKADSDDWSSEESDDEDEYSGLSRKERRKLRKLRKSER